MRTAGCPICVLVQHGVVVCAQEQLDTPALVRATFTSVGTVVVMVTVFVWRRLQCVHVVPVDIVANNGLQVTKQLFMTPTSHTNSCIQTYS
jgi:hypothetical protein